MWGAATPCPTPRPYLPAMPEPLPAPASTTEVYLAAILARLDQILEAIAPPPVAVTTPAPRRRASKPTT